MREILFWGATGQAGVLHEAMRGTDLKLVAIVDNNSDLTTSTLGVRVLHGEVGLDGWLEQRKSSKDIYYAVAVGGDRGRDRLLLMDALQARGLRPLTIVHRTAFVADNATIGSGCQILAQAAVCVDACLGRGVIVNTAASVDHDCQIGDGVHLAPGVRLAGNVTLGQRVFIGTGAVVLPRVHIGDDAIVGAGAVVLNNVPSGVTVLGNPARIFIRRL
ncbi:MAG: acetyltransferase [Acidocella sp.]|nr:acetyltransferase [Acidocella sp.]